MARGIKSYRFFTAPIKGLNRSRPALLLAEDEAADIQNMIIDQGRLRTRPGYEYYCSAINPRFLQAYHYETYDGATSSYGKVLALMNHSAGRLWRQSGAYSVNYQSTATWSGLPASSYFFLLSTNGTSACKSSIHLHNLLSTTDGFLATTEILAYSDNNPRLVFAWGNVQDNPHPRVAPLCYIRSAHDMLRYMNLSTTDYQSTWCPLPTSATTARPAPVAKIVRGYEGHLVLLNTFEQGKAYPWRVRWPHEGFLSPNHWPSEQYADLMDTPGAIVNAEILYNQLVVYKTDAIVGMIYLANANETFRFDWYFKNEGLLAPGLLVNLGNSHIFVGTQNIYQFYGGNNIDRIGEPVWDQFLADLDDSETTGLGPVRNRAVMVHFRDLRSVAIFIPTTSQKWPQKAYVYQYDQRVWTIWKTAHNVSGWGEFEQSIGDEVVYLPITGDTAGKIYSWDGDATADLASAISQFFVTKAFVSPDGPGNRAYADMLDVDAIANSASDQLSIQHRVDGASAWTNTGTLTLSGAGQSKTYQQGFHQAYKRMQLRFVTSAAHSRPHIELFGIRENMGDQH